MFSNARSPYAPKRDFVITARFVLGVLTVVALVAAAIHWWEIQSSLTSNLVIAAAWTALLTFAPPATTAFLVPGSPGGMLLQRLNAQTWGQGTIVAVAIYLLYYSSTVEYSWWAAQPNGGVLLDIFPMAFHQTVISLIGFIFIPAIMVAPVSSDELTEKIRQAYLVRRYELLVQADIEMLRGNTIRWNRLARIGLANLTPREKADFAGGLRWLVEGIDTTLEEINTSVKRVSGEGLWFSPISRTPDLVAYLEEAERGLYGGDYHGENPAELSVSDRLHAQHRP